MFLEFYRRGDEIRDELYQNLKEKKKQYDMRFIIKKNYYIFDVSC